MLSLHFEINFFRKFIPQCILTGKTVTKKRKFPFVPANRKET